MGRLIILALMAAKASSAAPTNDRSNAHFYSDNCFASPRSERPASGLCLSGRRKAGRHVPGGDGRGISFRHHRFCRGAGRGTGAGKESSVTNAR